MPGQIDSPKHLTGPNSKEIADRGSAIYNRRYRTEFESKWLGLYAVVDVKSEQAVVEEYPETALAKARAKFPDGTFYLLKIGSAGAFKLSRRVAHAYSGRV